MIGKKGMLDGDGDDDVALNVDGSHWCVLVAW